MRNKNIVLCSDGTGNTGGYGSDSNVYKTYKAVDVTSSDVHQFTFYEQGVGTDKSETNKNKYRKALSGAFGFGFGQNVLNLYHFLARCYQPGDAIFLFGFSRGAATVRAFTGFVHACGLVDIAHAKTNGDFDSDKFKALVEQAFDCYRSKDKVAQQTFKQRYAVHDETYAPNGDLKIKFIGVWDTVSALGFSKDFSVVLRAIFTGLETVVNKIPRLAHDFYDYELNNSIENAYHALSIDDERQTFHPMVWNEHAFGNYVEQVWFAGVHSNVGGGYPRTGMSNVALEWMLSKAAAHGLVFYQDHLDQIRESANVYDKLYDSRDGVAIYYRYGPRDLSELCASKLRHKVAIHYSAYRKLKEFSEGYAPDGLPANFDVIAIDEQKPAAPKLIRAVEADGAQWTALDNQAKQVISSRKNLYRIFVELTMAIIVVAGIFWKSPPEAVTDLNACEIEHIQIMQVQAQSGQAACRVDNLTSNSFISYQQKREATFESDDFQNCSADAVPDYCQKAGDRPLKWLGDILRYVTPVYFENFITYVVEVHSWIVVAMLLILYFLEQARKRLVNQLDKICRRMSDLF